MVGLSARAYRDVCCGGSDPRAALRAAGPVPWQTPCQQGLARRSLSAFSLSAFDVLSYSLLS